MDVNKVAQLLQIAKDSAGFDHIRSYVTNELTKIDADLKPKAAEPPPAPEQPSRSFETHGRDRFNPDDSGR